MQPLSILLTCCPALLLLNMLILSLASQVATLPLSLLHCCHPVVALATCLALSTSQPVSHEWVTESSGLQLIFKTEE
jgi:hypothetical protein